MYVENTLKGVLHVSKDLGTMRRSDIRLISTSVDKDTGRLLTPYADCKYVNVKNFKALCDYIETHLQP